MIDTIKNLLSWFLTRVNKGYALVGSVVNAVNFAGIFTLLLSEPLGIPVNVLLPILIIGGVVSITIFSFIVFDKLNFQTNLTKELGLLDDYWHKKLVPMEQKILLATLEAIEDKNKIEELKEKVKSGYL